MPPQVEVDCNTIKRKCGEIILTMKKNSKNVYSFNCWFCDTICIQMKKFTMHLEQEHEKQLEQPILNAVTLQEETDDKLETCRFESDVFVPEIKVEDCLAEDIKLEDEGTVTDGQREQHEMARDISQEHSILSNLDPLETLDGTEKSATFYVEHSAKESTNSSTKDKTPFKINNLSKDDKNMSCASEEDEDNENENDNVKNSSDYSEDDSSSSSEYKVGDSADEGRKKRKSKLRISEAKEKLLIAALINAFKDFPQLWDTSQGEKCSVKQKNELLQIVTDKINSELSMNLKLYTIKKKLSSVYKAYENELKNDINNSEQRQEDTSYTSKLWYYDKMKFMKTCVENKLKNKRKKPNHRVKPLNETDLCEVIEIYKSYNSLWDVNHLAFTVKEKRLETMKIMLDEINNKLNMSLDIYKLERHLTHIHKTFAEEKRIKIDCEKRHQDYKPLHSNYIRCAFLEQNQGPFLCSVCSEVVETYNDFQIHKSTHDSSMPFKCQECGMGFKKISNYTIHAKRHLRVFKFHCDICGKGYPFNAELDLHMRSHTGAQPYLCSICGEGFRTAISYDNHIRRHEERFKYFCHICKKGFNHMTRLNDHVKAHLNVRDVICTVCGKGFTSRKYLNHHKRIHEGKNYSCNICGKSFAQDAGLRAHKKYHGTPIGVSSIQKDHNKYNLLK